MPYQESIKNSARKLRSQGKTYSEINKVLNIKLPKSTLSSWCRDAPLPSWYHSKISEVRKRNFTRAQQMAWASNKIKREKLINELLKRNGQLVRKLKDKDVLKMILAALHLGEGAKWKSHHGLMLGSSEPELVKLYIKLLKRCYGIPTSRLRCRVSYRADQNIDQLERYWSTMTGVPTRNFYETKPDPRTLGRPTRKKDYKGVCVVMCGGTDIQLELEAIPGIILRGL